MFHFGNDEREFSHDAFNKKSNFDLKRKDAAIELYWSRFKEGISYLDYKIGILILQSVKEKPFIRWKTTAL